MTQFKTVFECPSGGVIYRQEADTICVCLIATQRGQRWQLPKGAIEPQESPIQAAQREVREETGLQVKVVAKRIKILGIPIIN